MIGPGKYDAECEYVTKAVGVDKSGGAVIVIVVNGNRGDGFSCNADIEHLQALPEMLEMVAKQLRADRDRINQQ